MHIIKVKASTNNKQERILPSSWQKIPDGDAYKKLLTNYFTAWYAPQELTSLTLKIGGLSAELFCDEQYSMSTQIILLTQPAEKTYSLEKKHYTIVADPCHMPFNHHQTSIDHIFLINTLNFYLDNSLLIQEINRIISNDGLLYFSIFNPFMLPWRKFKLKSSLDNLDLYNIHVTSLLKELKKLNFNILDVRYIHPSTTGLVNKYFSDLIVLVAQKQTRIAVVKPITFSQQETNVKATVLSLNQQELD